MKLHFFNFTYLIYIKAVIMSSQPALKREQQIKDEIHQKLTQSGEKERSAMVVVNVMCRLRLLLHARLTESGWRDQVKAHCKGLVSIMSLLSQRQS